MLSNNNIIYSIIDNSFDIYDGLIKKKIDINKLYEIIKNKEDIYDLNIINISEIKIKKMLKNYKKEDFLDEILLNNEKKYKHLIDVRHLINLDEFLEYILPIDIFIYKVRIMYTYKIIDILVSKYYDYNDIKLLSKLKENVFLIEKRVNLKIMKRIKQYYVKKITV